MLQGKKTHRHELNPKEKEIHDLFIKRFVKSPNQDGISRIVNDVNGHGEPETYLDEHETELVITAIQWLGSHVGQGFLRDCGFELKK